MARILTGIQSTGIPHLGNILGAIIPAIKKSETKGNESFLFIADLHSLTQIKNADELKKNTLYTAAAWLSFGLNTKNTIFLADVCRKREILFFKRFFLFYKLDSTYWKLYLSKRNSCL